MKFYYSPGACSIAAHIALELANAEYSAVCTAIARGENVKPEFLTINPQGRVPALVIENTIITELPAILLYIDRAYPQSHLMPKDLIRYAQCVSMMAFLSSNVHIMFAAIWRPERFVDQKDLAPALERGGLARLQEHYSSIEARLAINTWFGGDDSPSLADINLLPFYRFGLRVELPMSQYQKFTALVQKAETIPAVRRVLDTERIESFLSAKPAAL